MKKKELENRIKELEFELNFINSSKFDVQKWHENENLFHNLIEKTIHPILIFKGEDMILDTANSPLLKIFKVGKEALGKPFLDILPEMKDQPFMDLLLDVFHNHTIHYGKEQPAYFEREHGERETIYFNFCYHPYKENDGTVSGVIVNATDVTELVLARQKAEENEANFRSLVMQTPVAIGVYRGKEYIAEIANQLCLQVLNKGADFVGKPLFDVLPELETQGFKALMDTVMQSGTTYYGNEWEFYINKNNKSTQGFYNFVIQPLRADDKTIAGIIVVANEITEQILARKKAEESEKNLQDIFYQAPTAIAVLEGENHKYVLANALYQKMINRTEEQILGKTVREVFPELQSSGAFEIFNTVFNTGEPFLAPEFEAVVDRFNDGSPHTAYYNFSLKPLKSKEKITSLMLVAYDITEQILVSRKIEESEHRYQSMVYSSPYMIAILKGEDMIIEIANDSILESWGKGKNVIGKSLFEVIPESVEQGFDKLLLSVYKTGEPVFAFETPITLVRNAKKELMHYTFIYQAQRNMHGEIEGVAVLANEVTPQVEAKMKIKESEERFRSLADNIPLNVFIIEPTSEAKISYWNKYWLDYTGQTMENALGRTWNGIVHPDDVQPIMDVYVAAFEKRLPYKLPDIRIKRYDGEYKWFAFQANPRFLPNGEFMGYIGVGFDIHEKKLVEEALKQSEAHFRLLADLIPSKISNALADGSVTYFNKHWLDFSGFSFEELRDFGYHQIMHPDEMEEFQTRFQKAASTLTDLVMEMRFKNKDGDYIWHLNIASPIKDEKGNLKMWIGVTTDISEQIKTRNSNLSIYEKHAAELKHEKELAELATLKAEVAVKSKQQFLSNMSHEIRTPLNSILGFTNVLMKTKLDIKQKEFLQAIKTSSNSLHELINDILDLAKVDAGKMTFLNQPFEIHKSIKSILHSFDLKLKEKNLELVSEYDSEIPLILLGDKARLNQIILNLMSNAIKFTHKGKIILSVKIQSEDEENISIEFAVTDSGIGISENKINLIFNLFEQAEINTSNSYGGTGLGLAIVKQLVELQGGSISVSSKIGEGSTFSFVLSFGKTNKKTVEKIETLKLDSKIKNVRVLVAEDVALNELLIKIILSDFGFEYEVVKNGKIVIEKLQTNTYDIILMDLQMPEMNGFEAAQYIRKTMKSKIPIIALTADVTTADVAKCKECGMDDYISKPIDENQLYIKIVELVTIVHDENKNR